MGAFCSKIEEDKYESNYRKEVFEAFGLDINKKKFTVNPIKSTEFYG